MLLFLMNGIMLSSWADRGVGKKKSKLSLNLNTPRSTGTVSLTLKSGLSYKGNQINSNESKNKSFSDITTLSYKKGNTIYIIPYKQKVVVPDVKQGYTGVKLIIKPKL